MSALWSTTWKLDPTYGTIGDWAIANADEIDNYGGFTQEDSLGSAILIALFTDARIPTPLLLQYGFTIDDQREWHGNLFDIAEGEAPLGSWLWLLRRAPLTDTTARLAEHFASLALQPLIQGGMAAGFTIRSQIDKSAGAGRLSLLIQPVGVDKKIYLADLFSVR